MQQGLRVRNDGSLRVLPGRGACNQPEGVLLTRDTFDAEGRWLREVAVPADGDPGFDGVRLLGVARAYCNNVTFRTARSAPHRSSAT